MEPSPHPVVIDSASQRDAIEELESLVHKKNKLKQLLAQFTDDNWKFRSKFNYYILIF
jgi:hypothetical protein